MVSNLFRTARSWSSQFIPKPLVGVCSCSPFLLCDWRPFGEKSNRLKYVSPGAPFFSADELDAVTRKAKGGDAAGDIRRLEDTLKRLRDDFQEANNLANAAEETAAKCQVGALVFVVFFSLFLLLLLLLLLVDYSFPRQRVVRTFVSRSVRSRSIRKEHLGVDTTERRA